MSPARRSASYILALVVGVAIGWAVSGRTKATRPNPLAFNFAPGHEIRIVQPALSGDAWRLTPFAVHHDDHKVLFDEPPSDPAKAWIVTYDGVIVSCRSEQAPSQHP